MVQRSIPPSNIRGFRYLTLADKIETGIHSGTYRAGEKLPSIRSLHADTRLSISTVYQAFIELEKRGLVEPRPKSGYFVKPLLKDLLPVPKTVKPSIKPKKVTINSWTFTIMEAMADPDILQLGGSLIAPELTPGKLLSQCLKSTSIDELASMMATYENPMGHIDLRRQIAQRQMDVTHDHTQEEIIITNGCMEAVAICLQAVADKGDTIIVESPTFPGYLQLIQDLKMYAIEIPTDPREGIELGALATALDRHVVKACIFNSNFQNPLGFTTSKEKKQALIRLLNARNVPVIEDDIYGELYFGSSRPVTLKHFDTKGLVMYCSSFSKTLSPGLRIGWTNPGRFMEKVKSLKLYSSISSPTITQHVMSQFLKTGAFNRHLRKLRAALQNQIANTTLSIARNFPDGTRISTPQGGLTLWVQLPHRLDSMELFRRALAAKIAVLPGFICATTDTYRDCIRISCGMPFSKKLDRGLQKLSKITRMMDRCRMEGPL